MAYKKRRPASKSTGRPSARPSDLGRLIKRKRGRPPFVATEDQRKLVVLGASNGLTHPQIARFITPPGKPSGISVRTLERHFAPELKVGQARATLAVVLNLFAFASGQRGQNESAVTAAIFWLKCRMRWKPSSATSAVAAPGLVSALGEQPPIEFTINLRPPPRPDEDTPEA